MSITHNLHRIQSEIEDATRKAERAINSVTLLAVSKAQKINHIAEAYAAGQKLFGENYLSEALPKISALKDKDIEWHFIGPIQSNKTRDIAEQFTWVQSVDRVKIARRLNDQRPDHLPPLNVCIQLNLFDESSKQGIGQAELADLTAFIQEQPKLHLRGVMAIPPKQDSAEKQCEQFQSVARVFHQLAADHAECNVLSMGMSGDMNAAIACGSTMVRVGTALFGQRPANWKANIKS